jgi:hypothetical protein
MLLLTHRLEDRWFWRRAVKAALAVAVLGGLLGACGGRHAGTTSTTGVKQADKCPLTNLSAPGGQVPDRPALAVKVDNLAAARPQYGLSDADVTYEEPVEGGITRLIAIYQCRDAARIEPVRSGRIIDPAIVSQFGAHPLFAYAGAIQPAVAAIDASPLVDVGIYRAPAAYRRDPDRLAPHNLVTSTAALYAAGAAQHAAPTPPGPVFSYGPLPADARPAMSVHVAYPYSDVTWTWNSSLQLWLRSYANSGAATLGEGGQITAANVVIMKVVMYPSPYVEDPTGAHENLLVLTGSGPTQIFRDGATISGSWTRPALTEITRYLDTTGRPITLGAGPTWVELVPSSVAVTLAP